MTPDQTVGALAEKSQLIIAFLEEATDLRAIDGCDTEIVFCFWLPINRSI